MDDISISLCVSYPHRFYEDKYVLFRIADFNPETGKLIEISSDENGGFNGPKIIGARPSDVRANMAVLRKWTYDVEDTRKTISFENDGTVYEVIRPTELSGIDYSNPAEIRRKLFEGITIDDNCSDEFLIVIGRNGTHNAVISCHKRDLKPVGDSRYAVPTNTQDMLHSLLCFDEYGITDDNIIASANDNISLPSGTKAPIRYFYNSITLPERVAVFRLFNIDKFIAQYISNFTKKNKTLSDFSSGEIKKIVSLIEQILDDENAINEYYVNTGYNSSRLAEEIPKYSQIIVDSILNESQSDCLLQSCLLNSEDVLNKCIEIVRKQWLQEKNQEQQCVIDKINELVAKQETINYELSASLTEKENLSKQICQLQQLLDAKNDELLKVQSEIEHELLDFSSDVVRSTALCSVIKAMGCGATSRSKIEKETHLYDFSEQDTLISDTDDFQDYLSENLEAVGYDAQAAMEMSQLLTHCIANRLPVLLSTNETQIAECVAAMFSSSVTILNADGSTTFSDISEQISNLKNTDTVFLIKGAFSGMSSLLFEAIYECSHRIHTIFMFSLNGAESYLLPQNVLEKSLFLDCDYGLDYVQPKTLKGFKVDFSVLTKIYDEQDVAKQKEKLTPYIKACIISNVAANNYAKFMVDIVCNINKDRLALLQLCIMANSKQKNELLQSLFDEANISVPQLSNYLYM